MLDRYITNIGNITGVISVGLPLIKDNIPYFMTVQVLPVCLLEAKNQAKNSLNKNHKSHRSFKKCLLEHQ